jgi:hypothetical protein
MILAETILGEQILKVDSDKERFIFMKKVCYILLIPAFHIHFQYFLTNKELR